jgi:hypothetical protein
VPCDTCTNIYEHQEERDEHGHPACHNLGGDQEAEPRDDHKESGGKVVNGEVLKLVPEIWMLVTIAPKQSNCIPNLVNVKITPVVVWWSSFLRRL